MGSSEGRVNDSRRRHACDHRQGRPHERGDREKQSASVIQKTMTRATMAASFSAAGASVAPGQNRNQEEQRRSRDEAGDDPAAVELCLGRRVGRDVVADLMRATRGFQ